MRKENVKGIVIFVIIVLSLFLGKELESRVQNRIRSTEQSIEQSTVQSNLLEDEILIHFYEENPGKEDVRRLETAEGTVISIGGMKIIIETQDGLIEGSSEFTYNTTTERGCIVVKKEE